MASKPLVDRVAWVTGSSRGIGRVIASHLASLGALIAVHGTGPYSTRAFEEAESLQAVADAIAQEQEADVLAVWGDLTNETVVKQCADQIRERFGRIDVLVNCAGGDIGAGGVMSQNAGKPALNDALSISVDDLRVVVHRNLLTCILACR